MRPRELPTIAEAAVEDFVRQQRRIVLADPLQPCRHRNLCRRLLLASLRNLRHHKWLALADDCVALGFDLCNLPFHKLVLVPPQ